MPKVIARAVLCASALSGCAIHPEIDDVTGDAVPDILMKIRCEAKSAILKIFPDENDYRRSTSIAWKFELTMFEKNDRGSTGSVKIPISLGSFTMGWDAGVVKERRSLQTYGIDDDFKKIIDLPCHNEAPVRNHIYPITGQIGLLKTMENYVRIVDENHGLVFKEWSDVLKFQTDWNASLKPSWNLNPVSKQVIGINGVTTDKRSDIHQLTISFKVPARPLTTAEKKAKVAAEDEARRRELNRLAEEKKLPTHFVLVDPDNRPVDPRTLFGQAPQPRAAEGPAAPGSEPRPAAQGAAPADDEKRLDAARNAVIDKAARSRAAEPQVRRPARAPAADNGLTAYEQLQQNEFLRTQRQILEELRAR